MARPENHSATSRLVDPRRLRPRLAVLAFRASRSNSYIAAPFSSLRRQSSLPAQCSQKSHVFAWLFKWLALKTTRPLVGSLTLAACGPGSRYSPFALRAQTRTSLRLSRPYAGKAVCLLSAHKKATCSRGFLNGSP